jgi:hypothetical protein
MKTIWSFTWGAILCLMSTVWLAAQPIPQSMDNLRPGGLVNACANLRIISQSSDKTETLISIDYTYDGTSGMTAKLIPMVEKKSQQGISRWFGANPISVTTGRGIISFKIKYFNDESGVPPEIVSDRLRILFMNAGGTTIVGTSFFLKTIHWGSPDAKPTAPSDLSTGVKDPAKEARVKSEEEAKKAESRKLEEQKQIIEERSAAQEKARQTAILKAQAEEQARLEAEAKAKLEAQARETARLKAEQELKRLAEEQRQAREKAQAELAAQEKTRREAEAKQEEARQKAEAEAQQLAKAKLEVEKKAKAQAAALEEARKKAEAEAREEARIQAEQEFKKLAEEQRLAREKAQADLVAQEKARREAEVQQEAARLRAEAEAQRLAEAKRAAEEKAQAQATALAEARLQAEVEAKARQEAEAKAKAEAEARESARAKAEAQAKRMAAEQRFTEAKARQEAAAREAAKNKAEAQAKRMAEEKAKAPSPAQAQTTTHPVVVTASGRSLKTKITNVDIVNRSLDRTQMTIGVEFEYQDTLDKPLLGVKVARTGDPETADYFESTPLEIGRSKRNFALLPITFNPPASQTAALANYSTDKLIVYLLENTSAQRFELFTASMLLRWRPPGNAPASAPSAASTAAAQDTLEFDDLKQNDLYSGYVTLRYRLAAGPGKLRLKILEAAKPESAGYFKTTELAVPAGRNAQLLEFSARPDAPCPTDIIKADTVEVELLDASGKVAARLAQPATMSFARPK